MNPIYLQIILQGVSSFAIAGGLIFTAIQFRQSRKAQHVANFSKLVELQMELRRMRVEDPTLAGIDRVDIEHLHSEKEIREYYMNLMQLSLFEIAWFSHRQRQIPDSYFHSWIKRMSHVFRQESFLRMFNSPTSKIMDEDFRRYVADLVRAANELSGAP
jgi:hypothetical protein